MLPDRVSNPGPLTYESGALPIHILLYSFILPIQFRIAGAQETKISYFKLAFSSLLKRCHLWPRSVGEAECGFSLRTGRPHSGALYNRQF